jgi:hypothetical protein
MPLSHTQREAILRKVQKLVSEKYFDPNFDETLWNRVVENNRKVVLDAESDTAFERAVARMLVEMAPNPLALLLDRALIAPPNAINASFSVRTIDGETHRVFKMFFRRALRRVPAPRPEMSSWRSAVNRGGRRFPMAAGCAQLRNAT